MLSYICLYTANIYVCYVFSKNYLLTFVPDAFHCGHFLGKSELASCPIGLDFPSLFVSYLCSHQHKCIRGVNFKTWVMN